MIGWSVEWWTEEGDVVEAIGCDLWEEALIAVEEMSHKVSLYDTIAICVCDLEVHEEERWEIKE
jgi:hypothetical protein